jgi:hypothetical protein
MIFVALYNSEADPVFPVLSEYMQMKTLVSGCGSDRGYPQCLFVLQEENEDGELLGFNIVATKLLGIVTAPIQSALATKLPQVQL